MFQDSLHGFFAVFILTSWNCISNMIFEAGNIAIYITSCIPILSMFILPTAYLLNKASLILLVISFAILIITLFIVYKFVTNSFKSNILDLGKKKVDKENKKYDLKEIEKSKLEKTRLAKYVTCVAFTLILSLVLGNLVGLIPMFFTNEITNTIRNRGLRDSGVGGGMCRPRHGDGSAGAFGISGDWRL